VDIIAQELSEFKPVDMLVGTKGNKALVLDKRLIILTIFPPLPTVSREPTVHAHLLHEKDRVVIQDFFMATPKHPFFKFFLDEKMEKFNQGVISEGPFSQTIEKDIDRYRTQVIKSLALNTTLHDLIDRNFFVTAGDIFELPESILHPLVDSTKPALYTECQAVAVNPDALDTVKAVCKTGSLMNFIKFHRKSPSPNPKTHYK
jgi:hypothetical protein